MNERNADTVDIVYINIKKENILSTVSYKDLEFFFYYDDDSNTIILIEMKIYKDDNMEEKAEFYRVMDIILSEKEDKIHISYTFYRDNPGSIKNNEELEAFADKVIEEYTEECKQWYEKYFKVKEN